MRRSGSSGSVIDFANRRSLPHEDHRRWRSWARSFAIDKLPRDILLQRNKLGRALI
jgi:hypothetical protein